MSLTATGLERPRLDELKTDLDESIINVLGPVNTNADSVLGQLTGIEAAALDDAYEMLQDNYDSMYPASAEGVSLDRAVSFLGIFRLDSAPVVVTAVLYGTEGTIVPVNALAHADIQYFNTSAVTITASSVIDASVSVGTVADSTLYRITLNATDYDYTSGIGATAAQILAGLQAAISGYTTSIASDVLRIYATDGQTPFIYAKSANLTTVQFGSPAIFSSVENGKRELPAYALAYIDTPIFGWSSISNINPGAGSRDVESDIELRLRHSSAARVTGSATVKAIRARLLAEVAGVSSVSVYENRSHLFDGLQPPHSFETVVVGGTDQAVAQNIWENKPAGIETYGNFQIEITDDNGDLQPINFSRATAKYAWVRVTVTQLYPEETLPSSTAQSIRDAVLATGNALGVGEDMITQRFIGPIYVATQGLGMITVETAVTALPTDVPTYTTPNKAISRSEIAT